MPHCATLRGVSSAEVLEAVVGRSPDVAPPRQSPKPFDLEWVTLTKREHIALVMQAKQYKSLHARAVNRLELNDKRHRLELDHRSS